ncbi:LOW QUALITY PROTEIN: 24-methylenesterol C-methyltransferase 2-like [Asparagus officinalis]|uniref:LOW QUALITY PROTEIN: 24-methylenesterol C-methyltransferase 2-like n=1 Tax=Asparagus officinalis TaxID=4686 RepID=UPI00098E6AAB|nr:LOW QUALITY PROTEIN: 24-methylenesterol C-methyltransferase 2-like [Asparagus officinalis]
MDREISNSCGESSTISRKIMIDLEQQVLRRFSAAQAQTASTRGGNVPDFVDTSTHLVTTHLRVGWGSPVHFSPLSPAKSHREETRIHEERLWISSRPRPGQKILDVGCGVGGPMRAIAARSGSNVVGITINEYQVGPRRRRHNKKAGLDSRARSSARNFLRVPFADSSFDGAYSIEATCHAPQLEDVNGEVFRVLKPGGLYVSYAVGDDGAVQGQEPEQLETIRGSRGGTLLPGPSGPTTSIAAVAKKVGFEVLEEEDLAKPPAGPWWTRLKMGKIAYWRNHVLVNVMTFLRIAPKGVVEVHEMLYETAIHLANGGDKGIFSPMHMILCRKPTGTN